MCGLSGSGNDHFEASVRSRFGELDGLVGCLVGRQHTDFGFDTEVVENLGGLLHDGPVRARSHDDCDFVTHVRDGNRATMSMVKGLLVDITPLRSSRAIAISGQAGLCPALART